jgi:hypothetical protein
VTKTLITVALIVDVTDDELPELVTLLEESIALNTLAVLERRDAEYDDLIEAGFEFYGVGAAPIRAGIS